MLLCVLLERTQFISPLPKLSDWEELSENRVNSHFPPKRKGVGKGRKTQTLLLSFYSYWEKKALCDLRKTRRWDSHIVRRNQSSELVDCDFFFYGFLPMGPGLTSLGCPKPLQRESNIHACPVPPCHLSLLKDFSQNNKGLLDLWTPAKYWTRTYLVTLQSPLMTSMSSMAVIKVVI